MVRWSVHLSIRRISEGTTGTTFGSVATYTRDTGYTLSGSHTYLQNRWKLDFFWTFGIAILSQYIILYSVSQHS